jgi:transmembrane sensor
VSETPALPYTDAQRREAAEWFVAIRAENDPKAESIQAWLRWMDENEGHRAAFDAVARAWHSTPASSALDMPSAAALLEDDYDPEQSVEEWLAAHSQRSDAAPNPTRPRVAARTWLAAAAVLIAIVGVLLMNRFLDPSQSDEFTTRTGEQMEITLSDGSHVWLGPRSKLIVAFDKERRGIQLTSGEAFFAVKKDAHRPFTVRSAGGDIVAVGTAFNVRALDEHVTVTVSEGVVAVTPKAQLAVRTPASVRVASGQQLTFTAQQPIQALAIVQSASPGERARWREGVLVYRDEPLQEVVKDIVRYSDVQIEIADPAVGEMRFSGVVYDDAVHEWIAALPESFPVTIVSDGARELIKAR